MAEKVIAAMSGGVDSSVAAYLLVKDGYDVTGVTMKLFRNEDVSVPEGHTCCSLEDAEDAGMPEEKAETGAREGAGAAGETETAAVPDGTGGEADG